MPNQIEFYPQGGGALQLINEITMVSAGASVTFANIPQTFKNLKLSFTAGSSQTNVDNLAAQFNGDTDTNYNGQSLSGIGSSPGAGQLVGVTYAYMGNIQGTSGFPNPGIGEISLLGYNSSIFYKTIVGSGQSSGSAITILNSAANWTNLAPITSIVLFLSSGANFVAGSTFSLYGMS